MKPPPTWENLPKELREKVVEQMDFKSRCLLGACSKANRNLVKTTRIFLENLTFHLSLSSQYSIRIEHFSLSFHILKEKESDESNALQEFFNFFETWNLKLKNITFQMSPDTSESRKFAQNLLKMLKPRPLKTEAFTWNWEELQTRQELWEMLQIIDAQNLKTLTIRNPDCWRVYDCFYPENRSRKIHNNLDYAIFCTEHWTNLEKAHIHCRIDSEFLKNFSHLQKFRIDVKEWSAPDVWQVIQNFRQRALPRQSYFKIYNNLKKVPFNLMLRQFDVAPNHEPLGFIATEVHTQRFSTVSEHHVLVVLLEDRKIRGIICRAQFVREDCSGSPEFVM